MYPEATMKTLVGNKRGIHAAAFGARCNCLRPRRGLSENVCGYGETKAQLFAAAYRVWLVQASGVGERAITSSGRRRV